MFLAVDGRDHIDGRPAVKTLWREASCEENGMHIRTRKLIGTFALLALVTVWALLAMAFAQFALRAQSEWVALLFYAVAGIGWALPAMPLVSWMVRPDPPQP
jgi:hypothetical protein